MKNLLIALHTLFFVSISAQVAIEKSTLSSTSSVLEFDNTQNKGIILPYVTSESAVTALGGTLIFDTNDQKVKYHNTDGWVDLSINSGTASASPANLDEVGGGVILGSNTSDAEGVLVLESTDKAIILPNVSNPHTNIANPEPGTVVYDSTSKTIAFYNGTQWSYWGEARQSTQ